MLKLSVSLLRILTLSHHVRIVKANVTYYVAQHSSSELACNTIKFFLGDPIFTLHMYIMSTIIITGFTKESLIAIVVEPLMQHPLHAKSSRYRRIMEIDNEIRRILMHYKLWSANRSFYNFKTGS